MPSLSGDQETLWISALETLTESFISLARFPRSLSVATPEERDVCVCVCDQA